MYHTNFVHLHVHSHYSLLDGAASVKAIIDEARRFRMPAIALTDHGNMFGAIELYQYALKRGIKPILGFEAYVTPWGIDKRKRDSLYHLVLLAKNNVGYRNMIKLASIGYTKGFYYKPRVDFDLLRQYSEGIIALGACLAGEVPRALMKEDREAATEAIKRYQDIFGKENFYVEIQNHGLPEQIKILQPLVEIARECDAPIIATNDSHYVKPEDWEAQDALLCLGTNAKIDDENRFRFGTREFYLKSPEQMTELFKDYPDAVTNSLKIAERCNVQLTLGKSILPDFPIPEGKTSQSYLTELCYDGFEKRYGSRTPSKEVQERFEYEISVVEKMGFCDYFLIVWDFIRAAREMKVPVGPGRGSAAGSIVSYLLGITDIDPLKYGLLFERFLNPDRISMPDVDIDFSDDGRQRVIDYVVEKYGREKVSQIITFNFILAKMAIRDIGRVLGMELSEVNRIAKLVPEKPGTHIKSAIKSVPELKELVDHGTPLQKKLLRIATTVDGMVRHTGVHACGIVISREDLTNIVPVCIDTKHSDRDDIVTQYEKNAVENIGLLKMDFLGLKTLTILQRAIENVKETRGVEVDLDNISFDDKLTFELLQKALTLGVFQLESSGMRNLIKKLQPSVFEDVVALLAMYRPGPLGSGMVDDFVECKHGRQEIAYPHPDLEPILKDTYGVFLYQEQCMHTANILANFSMADADGLRKAMAKKIPEAMEKNGRMFVEGAVARGIDKEKAQEIFDLMASFGEYGFNKSHSAAYAVITFRTAYLKARYPVEFMAAVLSSEMGDTDKLAEYVAECRIMGMEILPPDVNRSGALFTVDGDNIRYALKALKGVGAGGVDSIINAREKDGNFKSLGDFTRRVDTRQVNSRVVDALIKAGAFDATGYKRSQLVDIADESLKMGQKAKKDRDTGQTTFFDLLGDEAGELGAVEVEPSEMPEFGEKDLLLFEKEVFGFYLTGDPYQTVAPLGNIFASHKLGVVKNVADGTVFRVAAILTGYKRFTTSKGDPMAFLSFEAENASLEVTVFPRTFEHCVHKLKVDDPFFMVVQAKEFNGQIKVNAEKILSLDDMAEEGTAIINFQIPPKMADKGSYQKLLGILQKNSGRVYFDLNIFTADREELIVKVPDNFRVTLTPELIKEWEMLCGVGSVKIEFPGMKLEARRRFNYNKGQSAKSANG